MFGAILAAVPEKTNSKAKWSLVFGVKIGKVDKADFLIFFDKIKA